jgi:putative acetyltransferase
MTTAPTVRRETAQDVDAVRDLVVAAFGENRVAECHLEVTSPSVRIPVAAFQVLTREGYDGSWMHGALVYPDVWWRHDAVGLRNQA